jgi:replicative DNA helicase
MPSKQKFEKKQQETTSGVSDYTLDRGLPVAIDAERSILGAMLLDMLSISEAQAAGLRPEQFALDSHRRIYSAMLDLVMVNQQVDLITLAQQLGTSKWLDAVGGVAYLSSLTDGVPRRASLEQHIQIVQSKWQRRQLINLCHKTMEMAYDESDSLPYIMSGLSEDMLGLRGAVNQHPIRHISEVAEEVLTEIREQMVMTRELIGLPLGIPELDLMTTGIREGDMVIVGGFPSSGKTAFAATIGLVNASEGTPVLFLSREMKDKAVVRRAIAQHTGTSAKLLRQPRDLPAQDYRMMEAAVHNDFPKLPFYIDDWVGDDIGEAVARARLAIMQKKIGLIILDFVQLLAGGSTRRLQRKDRFDMTAEVGMAALQFKNLAKETGIPVVLLSQLSRPEGKDQNTRPNMFMLRNSGELEQYSDLILFTFRPVNDRNFPTGEDEIISGKQREGEIGSVPAKLNTRTLRWESRELRKEEPKAQLELVAEKKNKKAKKSAPVPAREDQPTLAPAEEDF